MSPRESNAKCQFLHGLIQHTFKINILEILVQRRYITTPQVLLSREKQFYHARDILCMKSTVRGRFEIQAIYWTVFGICLISKRYIVCFFHSRVYLNGSSCISKPIQNKCIIFIGTQ